MCTGHLRPSGCLAWVCDPQDGRVHDTEDLRRTGRPGLRAVPGRPGTAVGRRPRWLVQRLHRTPKAPEMSCFRDVMVAGIV